MVQNFKTKTQLIVVVYYKISLDCDLISTGLISAAQKIEFRTQDWLWSLIRKEIGSKSPDLKISLDFD